jgi:two-component system sensor histidine kinase/response regulator
MQLARHASIRQKLTRIVLLTCATSVFVACTVFAVYDITTFRLSMANDLITLAEIVGANTSAALTFSDREAAHEILSSLTARPHIVEACIFTPDGRVFARYSRPGSDPDFTPPLLLPEGVSNVSGHMLIFRLIRLDGGPIGAIYMKYDLGLLYARAARFAGIILVVMLVSLLTAYLLASHLQSAISGPILELARTAFTVSTGKDYSVRAVKSSEDETGFLYDRFNEMLGQIELRDAALQKARDELELRVLERTSELRKEVLERTQAERALEERTTFLNSLIETTPLAVVVLDPDFRLQMCNRAFESLFLYRRQEILGRHMARMIPANLSAEGEAHHEALLSGKMIHVTTQRRRSDGTVVDVEVFSVVIPGTAGPARYLLLYQDITERKRAEDALLRAKEAAEMANLAKSEFLANMSHEIRTPMNGIIGMTGLTLDTDLTTEQREYLGMVKTSANSLLKLINDILDFSKIEAGKLDLDETDFPLRQSLGETLKTLGLRAHEKGVELAWRVGAGVPEFLSGDLSRLRQIIVNLAGNAMKFTELGEVVLEVEKESEQNGEILLHFKVKDTGIGIAAEKQKLIFEAFTQADGSTTRKYGGTGLGLAITAQIVELMGGKIWVESELGRGSTFHFTARFGIAKGNSVLNAALDPQLLHDVRILIVDDNATNRVILADMLVKWGMRVESAESAEAALAILEWGAQTARQFSVIITDLHMPRVDGFGFVEGLKKNSVLTLIPVLLLSSSALPFHRTRARELGIAAFLTKPIQPSELLDAVVSALSPATSDEIGQQVPARVPHGEKAQMKILLAEDNAVNRTLARKLLEKHGHTVVLTENGREALEALERETVDLVLMDLQMPVMDGLEAISAIRKQEKGTGAHLPIVALTAHAMKGDRERCLAAGADDYLTKPIHTPALFAALERIQTTKIKGSFLPSTPAKTATGATTTSLDMADALERVEGDSELLEEIARIFVDECAKTMAEIRGALEVPDGHLLEQLAHRLKGASSNLGARLLAQSSAELEMMARAGDLRSARLQINTVEAEVSKLLVELEAISRKVAH